MKFKNLKLSLEILIFPIPIQQPVAHCEFFSCSHPKPISQFAVECGPFRMSRKNVSNEAELAGAEIIPHAKSINSCSILSPRKLFHQTIGETVELYIYI